MAEVPEDPPSNKPEGLLEVTLSCPWLSGYAGPAWPEFCFLHVGVGGKLAGSKMLPFEMDEEDLWHWVLSFMIPVKSGWPGMSLDILVERVDQDLHERRSVVVARGGPHTSSYTAVIARARVPLLDALVIGDLDEEEDNKKRRRGEAGERSSRLEGTLEFGEMVRLLDWELPALRDVDGKPRSVVRGTVGVHMCLRRLAKGSKGT